MNQTNPFISQSAAQARLNQSRSRLRFAVFGALGVCLLVLVPVLGPGCKRDDAPPLPPPVDTNTAPVIDGTNTGGLPPLDLGHTNVLPPLGGVPAPTNTYTPPVDQTPVAPAAAGKHVVAKGDSFYTIGKKYGVTSAAIAAANPGVDSKKLKIGQELNVPAATAKSATPTTGGTAPVTTGGEAAYTVKSGDTLIRIAKAHGTTVKAIKAANALTTDRIKVGQKLKLPSKEAAAAPVAAPVIETAPAAVPPTVPALPALPPAHR